jgi:hypothetical protein
MIEDTIDPEANALAQALMAEITARLEDMANDSVDLHRATSPASDLLAKAKSVTVLIEAHGVLTMPSSGPAE